MSLKSSGYRVVHLPTSVGGNPYGLSSHLEKLGVESETWVFQQNLYQYPCTRIIWNKSDGIFLREFKRWRAILTVARKFDVIHFNYGTSLATPRPIFRVSDDGFRMKLKYFLVGVYLNLIWYIELRLYRLFRRPMFVHYQGDDARQSDFCLGKFEHSLAQYVEPGYYSAESDAFKRRMIRRMERYCHKLYAVNPDLMHVLGSKARFIPYCHISLEDWRPSHPSRQNRPLRIGHAPSHRRVKGTDTILSALNELAAEGHQFEVILVEGLSNEEARRQYEHVDIMIDQLHAGWYGGLAVELMAMGRPVMAYIRDEDLRFIPSDMQKDLPLIRVTHKSLKDDIKNVLAMTQENITELGMRSRRFVEKWHDPLRIAEDIKKDYEIALSRERH